MHIKIVEDKQKNTTQRATSLASTIQKRRQNPVNTNLDGP